MAAAAGIVRTQAHTMLRATLQRTAFIRCMLPTPRIEPAITCVVETGCFRKVANRIEIAADVSAQNPLRASSVGIPSYVPSASRR
jgi:hypothetical protein